MEISPYSISLTYDPTSFKRGFWISSLTVVAAVLLLYFRRHFIQRSSKSA